MSKDIALADEIVTALNGEAWAVAFTAEREYVPDWDVKDELDQLRCVVIPEERAAEGFERDQLLKTYSIVVCFAQRLLLKTRAELDGLLDLVEAVTDFLELGVVDVGGDRYVNTGWQDRVRFHPEELKRERHGGDIVYTGSFLAVVAFPFTLHS